MVYIKVSGQITWPGTGSLSQATADYLQVGDSNKASCSGIYLIDHYGQMVGAIKMHVIL